MSFHSVFYHRIIKVPLQDFYKIVQKLAYTTASIDTADGMAQHPRDSRNFSCRAINLPTKEDSYRALQLSIDCIATVGSAQGNINGSGIVSGLSQLCCSSLYDSLAPVEKYDVYYLECDVNLDSSTTAGNGKPDSSKRRLSKAEKKMQKRGTTDENADKLKASSINTKASVKYTVQHKLLLLCYRTTDEGMSANDSLLLRLHSTQSYCESLVHTLKHLVN